MGQAIGQVLVFGAGVALSPMGIVPVVLMLATPRARVNGPSFVAGWIVGLAAAGAVVLLVSGGADASSEGGRPTWVSVLKIVLGLQLLLLAAKEWRGRPKGDEVPELPGWMRRIDAFTPVKSAGMAFVLSALNPKNIVLIVGAGAAIAQTGASTGDQVVALAVFVAIGALGPAIPVLVYFFAGERAEGILSEIRDWMTRSNAAIMAVICLLIGAKLIGDGIAALAS